MAQAQKTQSSPKNETPAPAQAAAKPVATSPDKNAIGALFKSYDAAQADVEKAEKVLEAAMAARSSVVEKLAEHGKTFLRNGKRLLVMTRTAKETGLKSFFFRGEGERTGIEVS